MQMWHYNIIIFFKYTTSGDMYNCLHSLVFNLTWFFFYMVVVQVPSAEMCWDALYNNTILQFYYIVHTRVVWSLSTVEHNTIIRWSLLMKTWYHYNARMSHVLIRIIVTFSVHAQISTTQLLPLSVCTTHTARYPLGGFISLTPPLPKFGTEPGANKQEQTKNNRTPRVQFWNSKVGA